MERIKPRVTCGDIAWKEFIQAINARPQRVVLRRDALAEVLRCNDTHGGPRPELNITEQGHKYVVVDREALFMFVQEHGAICGGAGHGR